MQILRNHNQVDTVGVQRGGAFGFNVTPETFEMLFKNIYKNPILACVRELACNARDAHVLAGTATKPFDVHVPSRLEPWFEIRDYGTGLSQQQVETLYTTFMQSSKQATNDFIGGLGIGSKSPLAYTDMFTVSSFFNGMKYTYIINKDETGIPCWNFVGDEYTDEANGLCVNVPVNVHDISAFMAAVQRTFAYIDVQPNILGQAVEIKKPEYKNKGDTWGYRSFNPVGMNGLVAIMGSIPYPIDINSLRLSEETRGLYEGILFTTSRYNRSEFHNVENVDLFFNIGQLSITPSREELQYDTRTVESIVKVLESVAAQLVDSIDKEFKSFNNRYEAQRYLRMSSLSDGILNSLKKRHPTVTFNGKSFSFDEINKHFINTEDYITITEKEVNEIDFSTGNPTGNKIVSRQEDFYVNNIDVKTVEEYVQKNVKFSGPSSKYSSEINVIKDYPIFIIKDEKNGNLTPKLKPLFKKFNTYNIFFIRFQDSTLDKAQMKAKVNRFINNMGIGKYNKVKVLCLSELKEDETLKQVKHTKQGVKYSFNYINILETLGLAGVISHEDVVNGFINKTATGFYINNIIKKIEIESKTFKEKKYYILGNSNYNRTDSEWLRLLLLAGVTEVYVVPSQRMSKAIRENWIQLPSTLNFKCCPDSLKKIAIDKLEKVLLSKGYSLELLKVYKYLAGFQSRCRDLSLFINHLGLNDLDFVKETSNFLTKLDTPEVHKILNLCSEYDLLSDQDITSNDWNVLFKKHTLDKKVKTFMQNHLDVIRYTLDSDYTRSMYSWSNMTPVCKKAWRVTLETLLKQ